MQESERNSDEDSLCLERLCIAIVYRRVNRDCCQSRSPFISPHCSISFHAWLHPIHVFPIPFRFQVPCACAASPSTAAVPSPSIGSGSIWSGAGRRSAKGDDGCAAGGSPTAPRTPFAIIPVRCCRSPLLLPSRPPSIAALVLVVQFSGGTGAGDIEDEREGGCGSRRARSILPRAL